MTAVRERHAGAYTFDRLSSDSPEMERFIGQVRLAAKIAAPVWLIGEPGSGKETVARVIHHAGIGREKMFVTLDSAGLQPYLIESLLWGHGGLAGTDRVGTVYLKNPAALPRDLQQQLIDYFTDDRPTTPRLICGAGRRAAEDVPTGKLLSEFHTALAILELQVPPLRERLGDLPRLISDTLARQGVRKPIDTAAMEVLKAQSWPRNLRELGSVLAEAATAAGAGPIKREHLPHELRLRAGLEKPPPASSLKLDETLEAVEKRLIQLALTRTGGNATKAADLLGIWRPRLLRRMEALGLVLDSR